MSTALHCSRGPDEQLQLTSLLRPDNQSRKAALPQPQLGRQQAVHRPRRARQGKEDAAGADEATLQQANSTRTRDRRTGRSRRSRVAVTTYEMSTSMAQAVYNYPKPFCDLVSQHRGSPAALFAPQPFLDAPQAPGARRRREEAYCAEEKGEGGTAEAEEGAGEEGSDDAGEAGKGGRDAAGRSSADGCRQRVACAL